MRRIAASVLFTAFAATFAAPVARADQPAVPKAEDAPKCLVTRAGDKDVSPPAAVDYTAKLKGKKASPVVAKALCKSQAVAIAAQWGKANGLCDKAPSFKFTATLAAGAKVETFANLTAACPK